MIVACMEPECIGVKAQSQGCGMRLIAVAGMWLRVAANVVDIICGWIC